MKRSLIPMVTALLILPGWCLPAGAQRVTNVSPEVDSQGISPETSISGQFTPSDGVTVQPGTVTLMVHGEDVTDRSTITQNFFTYRPSQALPRGPVQVQIEFLGSDGVRRVAAWQFTVQSPSTVLEIQSLSHNAAAPLGPNDVFRATLNGPSGGEATILLIENGQTVRTLATEEVSPGVYVANLAVPANVSVAEGIVVGRLRHQGQTAYAIASEPASFTQTATDTGSEPVVETPDTDPATTAVVPLAPEFTSHASGDTVSGNRFTLEGRTRPGATVDITVTGSNSLFGLVNVGQTLLDQQVTADDEGRFRVEVPVGLLNAGGTRYLVTAMARLNGEQASSELTLTHE
ncbi:uncharacterized protein XM38_022640 [Halomicronema hongdechloris C2206]|uniref:IPT/TIG domain-containing protein n=1 Tax=Halomicronema hongdechloris C2206 TaxID=1641165 RepID=A0A1Z3HLW6_9CYAN|nr:hypothetical protein [Halomicronema hongdechloris]ASC71312.1 uncharacterized protein XM38_022640 [Halomicronema hongdechloris C2206]